MVRGPRGSKTRKPKAGLGADDYASASVPGAILRGTGRIHFIGIGGIGMSGIAELLINLGYAVSGSDATGSPILERLGSLGAVVRTGHDASAVQGAAAVVVSSAIRSDNPELEAARQRRIPVIPRGEMLAELMRLKQGIAVAGAHGKTTTTSMVAVVLERAGLDPTAVIGGRLSAFGSNARLGRGRYMVVEADESDRSFLKLAPAIAVITNIDREHLESYGTFDGLLQAFLDFANSGAPGGTVVCCLDDPPVAALLPKLTRRAVTYGVVASAAEIAGDRVELLGFRTACRVKRRGPRGEAELGPLALRVPGRHNLLNALAAVAVGLELGVAFDVVAEALGEFRGVERRFEVKGEAGDVMVVDDYGHHPTEIAAVFAAARAGIDRRLVVAFQPHRYTRTSALLPDFARVLAGADEIVLTDVYAAGEDPIPGATVEALAEAVRRETDVPVHVVPRVQDVATSVASVARAGDLVITLGAGSIGSVGPGILREIARRQAGE